MSTHTVGTLAALLLVAVVASAQDLSPKPVRFPFGKTAATLTGTIKGEQIIDYVLSAAAGQQVNVTLDSRPGGVHFDVLPPASDQVLFDGSSSGNTWTGAIARGGEYTLRVYLADHVSQPAKYTLNIALAGRRIEK
jgi:hypothetical protein